MSRGRGHRPVDQTSLYEMGDLPDKGRATGGGNLESKGSVHLFRPAPRVNETESSLGDCRRVEAVAIVQDLEAADAVRDAERHVGVGSVGHGGHYPSFRPSGACASISSKDTPRLDKIASSRLRPRSGRSNSSASHSTPDRRAILIRATS